MGADPNSEAAGTLARHEVQFEILPLGRSEQEAAELPEPVWLTVTSSPKHGADRSVEVGCRLRQLGHRVTVHLAARMVADADHLDRLLVAMADAGVEDLFVIGGDATHPLGPYPSAGELLGVIAEHPHRPRTIGVAGYPEGHPLIEDEKLDQALRQKSGYADYVTTQMCFDPDALLTWIAGQRQRGIELPVRIGIPGKVGRRRLLEMSMRVGVGPSIKYVRKQHGLLHMLGRTAPDRLYDALMPALGDPQLNIAGFHFFTFNQLVETWRWLIDKDREWGAAAAERTATPRPPRRMATEESSK
jgi:methylenetetrahydrofolate reductase (NADPH)